MAAPTLIPTLLTGLLALSTSNAAPAADSAANPGTAASVPAPSRLTLELAVLDDLNSAEEAAARAGQIVSLPVRVINQAGKFHLRAGVLIDLTAAQKYAGELRSGGFPDCRVTNYSAEETVVARRSGVVVEDEESRWVKNRDAATLQGRRRADEIPAAALSPYAKPKEGAEAKNTNESEDSPSRAVITEGWKLLEQGALDQARQRFQQAETDETAKQDARYGLAHVFYRQGRFDEAAELLKPLVARSFRRRETVPLLTAALDRAGRRDQALDYAGRIADPEARTHWIKLVSERGVREDLASAGKNPGRALAALKRHSTALNSCTAPDAFFGAARDLLKSGHRATALQVFDRLVAACPDGGGIRKGALHLLAAQRPDAATLRVLNRELAKPGLPAASRRDLAGLRDQVRRAQAAQLGAAGPQGAPQTERMYREILRDHPDDKGALSALAWMLFDQGRYAEARDYFQRWRELDPRERSASQGLVLSELKRGDIAQAEALARNAGDDEMLLTVLRSRLGKLPPESPEAVTVANDIIRLQADDPAALTALAWRDYRKKEYAASERRFRRLLATRPRDADALDGLAQALIQQDRLDEAFGLARRSELSPDKRDAIDIRIYRRRAELAAGKGDDAAAEQALRALAKLDPGNADAEEWMGWTIYRQGDTQRAANYFRALYNRRPAARTAAPVLGMLDESGDEAAKEDFVRDIEERTDPDLHRLAADHRFREGDAVRAATIDRSEGSPYWNADSPWVGADFFHRERFGEIGTYRLYETGANLSYVQPLDDGTLLGFAVVPQNLSSGRAQTGPSSDPLWITDRAVVAPYFTAERTGSDAYRVTLGTTPLNGTIGPMPTVDGILKGKDWMLGVHQLPVNQSMLSFIGQQSSVAPHAWGRILRSGAVGSKTFAFGPGYWLSLAARYDYYWGRNVLDNHAVDGTVSAGRSFYQTDGKWSLGAFATNMHYSNSTNFFTYGHGGYYSPNWLFVAGPTLSYELHPATDYWLRADSSVNWFHTEDSAAAAYPIGGGPADTPPYPADVHSGVGYFFQAQGRHLLTSHLDWGLDLRYQKSAAFSDWSVLFGVRAFFAPHSSPYPLPDLTPLTFAPP